MLRFPSLVLALSAVALGQVPAQQVWGDADGDGLDDLYLVRQGAEDRLLLNGGDGSFSDATERLGLSGSFTSRAAEWVDFDRNGRLDLFVIDGAGALRLQSPGEGGTFVDRAGDLGLPPSIGDLYDARWTDYDEDGWLDLVVTDACGVPTFFHGEEGLGFTAVTLDLPPVASTTPGTSAPVADRPEEGPRSQSDSRSSHRSAGAGAGAGSQAASGPVGPGGGTGSPTAGSGPGVACMPSIADFVNPGNCLRASSVPMLGMLYALGPEFFIDTNGFVGLGTLSPTHPLTVMGDSIWNLGQRSATFADHDDLLTLESDYTTRLAIEGDEGDVMLWLRNKVGPYWMVGMDYTPVQGQHDFSIKHTGNATPQLIIEHDTSNVGIGTHSPTARLDVRGGDIVTEGQFHSTIAQGTAPFKIHSSTRVLHLNADHLDGYSASDFSQLGNTIGNSELELHSVSSSKIAPGVVDSSHVMDDSLTAADLASDSVSADELQEDAVTTTKIAGGAVRTAHIQDGEVSTEDLASDLALSGDVSLGGTAFVDSTQQFLGLGTGSPVAPLHIERSGLPSTMMQLVQGDAGASAQIRFQHTAAAHGYLVGQEYSGLGHAWTVRNTGGSFERYLTIDQAGDVELGESGSPTDLIVHGALSVGSISLPANTVGDAQLQDDAVQYEHVDNNAIGLGQMRDDSVGSDELIDGSVTFLKLDANSVHGGQHIQEGSVGEEELGFESVGTDEIKDATIAANDLGPNAVNGYSHIQDGSVSGNDLENGAVTYTKIGFNQIDTNHIQNGSIQGADLDVQAVDDIHLKNAIVKDQHVASNAAIAGTKISPNFGGQDVVTTGDVYANGRLYVANQTPIVFDIELIDTNQDVKKQLSNYPVADWNVFIGSFDGYNGEFNEDGSGELIDVHTYPGTDGYWWVKTNVRTESSDPEVWKVGIVAVSTKMSTRVNWFTGPQ